MNRSIRSEWPWIAAVILLAAVVYRPWEARALPLTDFGTFLPLLDKSESLWSQMVTITTHYAGEGRLCIFPYLIFVLAGNAFGMWAPGWYWTYFALNAVVVVLGWIVLRRTGVSRTASMVGLAFWVTMSATPEVWIRPTGEPVALVFFLLALCSAINFAGSTDWRRRIAIIALCSAGIVFSKELLVVLLPAGWLMSRVRYDGKLWTWVPWARRDTWLLCVTAAAVVLSMIPVGYVVLTAGAGNYVSQFGDAETPMQLALHRLETVLIPTLPVLAKLKQIANDPGWILLLLLPSLVWIRMIAGGLAKAGRGRRWPIAIAFVWFAVGIVSYIPWPVGDLFYMVPFAFGAMFGASHALDGMMSSGRVARIGTLAVSAVLICITSVEANTIVERYRLKARLNDRLVDNIASGGTVTHLIAGVRMEPDVQRWGWARNLQGFAKFARGTDVADSRDLTCDAARKALETTPGVVVVSRERGCGRLTQFSAAIDETTYRAQWPFLWERHLVTDRMYVTRSEPKLAESAVGSVLAPL